MHKYLDAGADMSFVESPESVDQMRRITREIPAPNMANMVPGGRTPIFSAQELEDMGFSIVAYPTMLIYTVARAAVRALAHLQAAGSTAGFTDIMQFDEFNRLIGLDDLRRKESELYAAIQQR
jgi:2,3-dimethylmalate lyase